MGKLVVIAGTPGTGKSTIGALVSSICNLGALNLSSLALEKGLVAYYDEKRQTYVINEEKLVEHVVSLALNTDKDVLVITHYPEILPRDLVKVVFILRTHPLELEKRLRSRGWSEAKINENVMAEILGVVAHNAIEAFGLERVFEIDTTNATPITIAETICKAIRGELQTLPEPSIDWLSQIPLELVMRYERYEGGSYE